MLERRFRRRRSLRSLLLFSICLFSLFACSSWYTLLCCRTSLYAKYITNNYLGVPSKEDGNSQDPQIQISGIYSNPLRNGHPQTNQEQLAVERPKKNLQISSSIFPNASGKFIQTIKSKQTMLNSILPRTLIPNRDIALADGNKVSYENDQPQLTTTSPISSPQSLPPPLQVDQYVVRAWLPRGIKERAESSSYEVLQGVTEVGMSGMDSYPVTFTPTTTRYEVVKYPRRRSVMISPPVKRLPQALIIGVKKCGTRALLEFLRVHPDVRASGPETHFFDRHYQRGLEWYRQQMPTSLEGQITMEKTPSYFITKEVPPRIHSMSPSVRLLVVVRDPVTRAISDYTQSTSKRKDTPSFEDMAFLNVTTGLVDTSWSAIRIGVYARFLEWWTRYFSLDRILFISGENLIRDPAGEMGRVQDFLDLKQVISDKHFYFNETKGFPCLKKSEGSGNPHCLGKTKGRAHPDISLSTIQRLRDFYRPFNMKFYQMVGRNFGWP